MILTAPNRWELHHVLIIAATHIGDPKDIPLRSLEALRTADLLIFEEDRPARQFLKAAQIHRDYLRFNEHNHDASLDEIKNAFIKKHTVVYMSDQGTANLADPGQEILALAYRMNVKVCVIPGPSSVTAALSACPFDIRKFYFAGFLSKKNPHRIQEIQELKTQKNAIVIMDTPYRLLPLLQDLSSVFGKNRRALVALDISGENERYVYDNCQALSHQFMSYSEKLNFVVVLAPMNA